MSAPRPTAARKITRRFAFGRGGRLSGSPGPRSKRAHAHAFRATVRPSQGGVPGRLPDSAPQEFPVVEIFSARVRNHLPRHPSKVCSRPYFRGLVAWHASWIRGDRDAPDGLPSLSPRHGLSIARRHRGTNRCLTAPVVPLPSTRVPAWPHGTVADRDDAAGCRKRKDGADDAAGRRTGKDEAAGRRTKDEAAGRRIKDEAAGRRAGPAIEAGPGTGSPSTQLQGMGRTRTRREAVRSQSRWRGSGQGCVAGPVVQTTGPVDFPIKFGDSGKLGFVHRPRRPVGEPGVRRNGSLRGALDRMRR